MGQPAEEISERVKESVERLVHGCKRLGANCARLTEQYGTIAGLVARFQLGMGRRAKNSRNPAP